MALFGALLCGIYNKRASSYCCSALACIIVSCVALLYSRRLALLAAAFALPCCAYVYVCMLCLCAYNYVTVWRRMYMYVAAARRRQQWQRACERSNGGAIMRWQQRRIVWRMCWRYLYVYGIQPCVNVYVFSYFLIYIYMYGKKK